MYCFDYKCDECHFHATAIEGAIGYYRFSDGTEMPALTRPAWCAQCKTITRVERLPDIQLLRSEIRRYECNDLNDFDLEHAKLAFDSVEQFVTSRTATFIAWISRFESREIPRRCIECGFSEFQFLASFTEDGTLPDSFPHVNCVGAMKKVGSFHASPATFFVLDGDGNRIAAARKAT